MKLDKQAFSRNAQYILILAACVGLAALPLRSQATSRAEEIRQFRIDKQARLWPERTSGIVKQVINYTERGFLEGAESGKGSNGLQFVLGGMREGNGAAFGVGYRRVDIWGERISFRTTARGTLANAYLFDFEIGFPRLTTNRGELRFYVKHEYSPAEDYYGPGPNSQRRGRSSYVLEDSSADLHAKYRLFGNFYVGASGGVYAPNTGPGKRKGFPTTDEIYNPEVTPGLGDQPDFLRASGTIQYDYRDLRTGPRSGGNYYSTFTRYWDQSLGRHTFSRLDSAIEQYLPYWNKTNVVALRLATVMTWTRAGEQTVPFYMQPTLGGNNYLRGFAASRFYDQNAILAAVEHRWHVFAGGHAALFFEMGKVTPKASQLNFHNLEYAVGIGFRFTIRDAVFMRIDNAVSREGYRFMWTFSNMW